MPNRCGRGTIPQTQSHEKTLPGRDRQIPAVPGQEAFLTPYLTTVRAGTRGNSGFKSVKKYLISSGKCRKALQITTKNLVQAFGSKILGIRVSPLGPLRNSLFGTDPRLAARLLSRTGNFFATNFDTLHCARGWQAAMCAAVCSIKKYRI